MHHQEKKQDAKTYVKILSIQAERTFLGCALCFFVRVFAAKQLRRLMQEHERKGCGNTANVVGRHARQKYQSKNIGGIIMQNLTHEQEIYIACLYGYSLQPESWQAGYSWRDFVVDADFSCRLGVLVKAGTEYEPIVSKEQAQNIYESMRESIEKVGLDEFYEQNFGNLY